MRVGTLLVAVSLALIMGCEKSSPMKPAGSESTPAGSSTSTPTPEATPAKPPTSPTAETPAPAETASPTATPPGDVILPDDSAPAPKDGPSISDPKDEGSASADAEPGAFAFTAGSETATLTGRFIFDGDPPKPEPLKMEKDLEYCGKYKELVVDESLTVGDGNGIADICLYVSDKGVKVHPDAEAAAPTEVAMDHKSCRYEPHAIGVWAAKTKIKFGNTDDIQHAVQFNSFKNGSLNQNVVKGATIEHVFQAAEKVPVTITCGIHPWEKGLVLVCDNPYFAVTGKDGTFKIENLPTGTLKFQAWQERAGYLVAKPDWKRGQFELELKAGENNLGEIKVPASVFAKKG